jgi:hypothetical protein
MFTWTSLSSAMRPSPRFRKAAIACRTTGSSGQNVGGVPGGTQVFPAVIPAPASAEISVWNGFEFGTSVNWWLAQASGTAIAHAAPSTASPSSVRLPGRRRARAFERVGVLTRTPLR